MSETYTPTPAEQDSSVTMVEDGDALNAASVRVTLEKLSNAVDKLEDKVFDPEIVSRIQSRFAGGSNAALGLNNDVVNANGFGLPGVACDGTYVFVYELDLAHGAELNQVRAYVWNDGSARQVRVCKQSLLTPTDDGGDIDNHPTETSLGVDTTVTTIATNYGYVAVTVGGTEIVDRAEFRYYAVVSGTADAAGTWWFGVRVLTEGNTIDKGAA